MLRSHESRPPSTSGLQHPLACWLLSALLALLASACASHHNARLDVAEARYRDASSNPAVQANAPAALNQAEASLDRARRAFADHEDEADVDHLSYLATRRVDIAEAIANKKAANDTTARLGQERQTVVAESRAAEATRAQAEATALAAQLSALRAQETERGIVVTIDDVLFDTNRAELKSGAVNELARVADFLRDNPDRPVVIEGHADSTGASGYNMDLSKARADSVASALIRQGVDPRQITTRGFGATAPVASNDTASGRQQNRRVEIVVQDPQPMRSGFAR